MLSEDKRNSRRTVADALDVLRTEVGFADSDHAQFRIGLGNLPPVQRVGLVQILFDHRSNAKTYVVSLPTARYFRAWHPSFSRFRRFEIAVLDGAEIHSIGQVHLTNGQTLHAVEVIPARLPLKPTPLDWCIVHDTIALINAQQGCYRSLKDELPAEQQDIIPDLQFLDCSKLSGLNIPSLREIASYIGDKHPSVERPSEQKIADALCKFRVRSPKPRARAAARHVAST
jgi:hypothetical protein